MGKWWESQWESTIHAHEDAAVDDYEPKSLDDESSTSLASRTISAMLQTLAPGDMNWCHFRNVPFGQARPDTLREFREKELHARCAVPLQAVANSRVFETFMGPAFSDP